MRCVCPSVYDDSRPSTSCDDLSLIIRAATTSRLATPFSSQHPTVSHLHQHIGPLLHAVTNIHANNVPDTSHLTHRTRFIQIRTSVVAPLTDFGRIRKVAVRESPRLDMIWAQKACSAPQPPPAPPSPPQTPAQLQTPPAQAATPAPAPTPSPPQTSHRQQQAAHNTHKQLPCIVPVLHKHLPHRPRLLCVKPLLILLEHARIRCGAATSTVSTPVYTTTWPQHPDSPPALTTPRIPHINTFWTPFSHLTLWTVHLQ
ncbi:hypothetical protein C8J57DRAFT_1535794 [Mycena rebaudengoi]|nr:hypothetical protein C8J57DRAFT_1535794 [Mycena rebaudengoi]